MTVTNTTGTSNEGTVGDLPESRVDELGLYGFGLFTYPQVHGGRCVVGMKTCSAKRDSSVMDGVHFCEIARADRAGQLGVVMLRG